MTLADLYHDQLFRMRAAAAPQDQILLAPLEHRAFAREYVGDNPLRAIPMAGAIPAYQLAKLLRLVNSRTGPSLDQAFAGYQGIGEGLRSAWR